MRRLIACRRVVRIFARDGFVDKGLLRGEEERQGRVHRERDEELAHRPNVSANSNTNTEGRTPNSHAKLYIFVAPPTGIFGLIELMRPGKFGGTESKMATTALQFCSRV